MANVYVLRECNSSLPSIYTNTALTPGISVYVGQVLQIAGYPDNCWLVIQGSTTSIPESVTIIAAYPDCTTCQTAGPPTPTIYRLRDCNSPTTYLYTNDVVTPGIASNVGGVVYLFEYPETCWTVSTYSTGSPVAYTLINAYEKCEECIAAIPEPPINVFILEDCLENEDPIYSFTTDLLNSIGKVIKLEGDDNICRSVSVVIYDEQTTEDVVILTNDADVPQIFDDCTCCLPAPEPAPVKYTRVIPKPDRHFYQITQSQCDIRANIRFADAYYRLFKNLKYGINSQCDTVNLDRVWIKKQLSDLAVINDPTACVITTPPVTVICPEPSGNPFIPPPPR